MSYVCGVPRWRIRLLGDLTPVRGLKNVAVQVDGSVIAEMGQSELIDHFDLLPSLGLELIAVERLDDQDVPVEGG